MKINEFNKEEKNFMIKHRLFANDFYDARGESKNEYHENAKNHGCNFVVHNCCHNGHRLKTRSGGHCIMCNPAYIAFQKRSSSGGGIYVAVCNNYCKVGLVDNLQNDLGWTIRNRENSLNSEGGYGGENDWAMVAYYKIDKDVGKCEGRIHEALGNYSVSNGYIHNGSYRTTKELYDCPVQCAINAVERILSIA